MWNGKMVLLACAAGMLLSGGVAIADPLPGQAGDGQEQPPAGKPDNRPLTPREVNEREQQYLAALKECEPLPEGKRQDCIDSVKARYGLM
jgi:hypothetical protein